MDPLSPKPDPGSMMAPEADRAIDQTLSFPGVRRFIVLYASAVFPERVREGYPQRGCRGPVIRQFSGPFPYDGRYSPDTKAMSGLKKPPQ